MSLRSTYTDAERAFDAHGIASVLIDSVRVHEAFTGTRVDPDHPNAVAELRRVAAQKHFGAAGYRFLWQPYRKAIDGLVDALLRWLREHPVEAS